MTHGTRMLSFRSFLASINLLSNAWFLYGNIYHNYLSYIIRILFFLCKKLKKILITNRNIYFATLICSKNPRKYKEVWGGSISQQFSNIKTPLECVQRVLIIYASLFILITYLYTIFQDSISLSNSL